MTPPPLIYLIAGEPSGDRLGAALIRALRRAYPEIEVTGLGGREMTQAGLTSLFDTDELAVMGIAEVLPRLSQLLRRIRETSEDVLTRKPAALVTIDSPSFGLRVSERVRRGDPSIPTIHYVAPSVWAWRPGRARHMARFTDHVLALLPFEPPYMEAAGMTCDFVGHPIAQRPSPTRGEVLAARRRWGLEEGTPTLLVAPGSRKSEVARLAPLFREVVTRAKAKIGGLRVLVPVAETVAPEVRSALADFPGDPVLIRPDWGEPAKLAAFAVADAALLASGTVTLEMAAARTPMVACYKTSWLTAAIVRRIVKVRTANLVNLVSGETPVPEFLQEYATPEVVSDALIPLLTDWTAAEPQLMAFEKVLGQLGSDGEAPEDRAAASILRKIGLASPQEEPTPPPFIPRSRGSG